MDPNATYLVLSFRLPRQLASKSYSACGKSPSIAAHAKNSQAILTPMIRADTQASFDLDVSEFLKVASDYKDTIYAVTVGSESLYRYQQDPSTGLKADDLLSRIQSFQLSLKQAGLSFKVGTADSWNKYQDGTANPIIPHVDIL